jgi:hypothetical protein
VDDLRVADVAANLVTYDKTTGELMDSGGLFANKLAVVSVQPPSALSANTTTIAKHGTYTVTTSSLAANSNAWNAFDGDSAVEWLGSTTSDHVYNGGEYTYSGTSNLFAGNYIQTGVSSAGEWLAIEFPYKTTLRHMKLTPPTTYQQYPASANVYATNDSLTWTELTNWSGVNPGDQQSNVQTIIVNATESYKKYAMVVTKQTGRIRTPPSPNGNCSPNPSRSMGGRWRWPRRRSWVVRRRWSRVGLTRGIQQLRC